MLTKQVKNFLPTLWEKTGGKAWEPPKGRDHPFIATLVNAGYLKHCVMRCGFEAMDTGVAWTEAGQAQFSVCETKETGS